MCARAVWLLLLVSGCEPAKAPRARCLALPANRSPIIARIGDMTLTMSDIERRLKEQGSAAQRYAAGPGLRRFIEDQVRVELLAQAAIERGLDRDPDVVDAARKVMARKLLLQDLGPQAWGDQVNDSAVRAYYEAHLDEYMQPERRRVAHVQLPPTPEGQALAQSIIDKLTAGGEDAARALGRFAAKDSLDRDSRGRGGELNGFVSRDELARAYGQHFADEAFKLKVGELSPAPVQSTRGWHVLLVIAKRDPYARGLEEVGDEIRGRLITTGRSQLFERYLRELRQRFPVAIYDDRLPELAARIASSQATGER
jgi:peptidyl-prolyl cis-trans isomerase C